MSATAKSPKQVTPIAPATFPTPKQSLKAPHSLSSSIKSLYLLLSNFIAFVSIRYLNFQQKDLSHEFVITNFSPPQHVAPTLISVKLL